MMAKVAKTFVLLVLIGIGVSLGIYNYLISFGAKKIELQGNSTVIIEVSRGEGSRKIHQKLESSGIQLDFNQFYWLGRIKNIWPNLKAGEYEIKSGITLDELYRILASGISVGYPITIKEGENIFEVTQKLKNYPFINTSEFSHWIQSAQMVSELNLNGITPRNLEGYLYPDTYVLSKKTTAKDLVLTLIKESNKIWTEAHETRAASLGWNRHQVITLASMVEKETGAPEERPLIASVFYNRLKKQMRLQSDPTTIYGIWHKYHGNLRNLRKSDLLEKNHYNTYAISGLPIGPIANPGTDAIQAVLYPANSEYLFFVSRNDGTHEFTKTFREHQLAVAKFQLDSNARKGKSWRDLKKRSTPLK